jgi:hypothetical protein
VHDVGVEHELAPRALRAWHGPALDPSNAACRENARCMQRVTACIHSFKKIRANTTKSQQF